MDNFNPYNVLLAIDTNIPVLLMTGFVVQGHIYIHVIFIHEMCRYNECLNWVTHLLQQIQR